jgi:hypothetical protein
MITYLIRYVRRYPFSALILAAVILFSLVKPPSTGLPLFYGWDKVVHFVMYAGASAIIWTEYLTRRRSTPPRFRRGLIPATLCPLLLGALLEVAQALLTDHRSGDPADLAANAAGIAVAALLASLVIRRKQSGDK